MKRFFGVLACIIAGVFALTGAGCAKKLPDTEDFLEIKAYRAGNGTEAIEAVAQRFMELNSGKTVDIEWNNDPEIVRTELPAGPNVTTVDLYLAGMSYFDLIDQGSYTVNGVRYDNRFESLNDVYEGPAYGETRPIKEKMNISYVNLYEKDGLFYGAPWVGGVTGIVYNSKMFDTYGWIVPVTTDELIETCEQILDTKAYSTNSNSAGQEIQITPFIYCMEDSYWMYTYIQWWAQYDGIQAFNNFYEGKNAEGKYTPDIVVSDGLRVTLELMEKLLGTYTKNQQTGEVTGREKIYTDPNLPFRSFTDVQSTFLYGEGARMNTMGATTAAMTPNGDWLENEMYGNFQEEIESGAVAFKMMKTPVISALSDKTSWRGDPDADEKLSTVIKWIDAGKTGEAPAFATEDDIKTVEAARGIVAPQPAHVMLIPAYATAKDLAKDFIRFLYSDEGLRIFAEKTRGITLPLECDYTGIKFSEFQKSKLEIESTVTEYAIHNTKWPIRYRSNLSIYSNVAQMGTIESRFTVSNPQDYLSATDILSMNYRAVSQSWQRMMEDAGLLTQ